MDLNFINFIGQIMNTIEKWKDVKCPYCNKNKMVPFFWV
jgi:hypothetical protein